MTPTVKSLERYLPVLRLHVRHLQLGRLYHVGGLCRARFDSWDVAQEAFMRADKGFEQVRGQSDGEIVAWLQRIVTNTFIDLVRENCAGKRDPGRERAIYDATGDGETPLGVCLAASQPGASTLLARQEELLGLAAALDRLPDDERDAVIAHFINELPLAQIAERLGRTVKGVAGLLFRGKRRLRELLACSEGAR